MGWPVQAFAARSARAALLACGLLLVLALVPLAALTPFAIAAEPGTSPLEQAAGVAASEVAGKPVQVRCHDFTSWDALTASYGYRSTTLGLARVGGTVAELAPSICSALDDLWTGSPLACTRTVMVKVRTIVSVWVTVQRRVLIAGKMVTRPVRIRKRVSRIALHPRTTPASCTLPSDQGWAVKVLAHETYHLAGIADEAAADCYALQQVDRLAARLGGPTLSALVLADPRLARIGSVYISPECREDGQLDMTPGDGLWP